MRSILERLNKLSVGELDTIENICGKMSYLKSQISGSDLEEHMTLNFAIKPPEKEEPKVEKAIIFESPYTLCTRVVNGCCYVEGAKISVLKSLRSVMDIGLKEATEITESNLSKLIGTYDLKSNAEEDFDALGNSGCQCIISDKNGNLVHTY